MISKEVAVGDLERFLQAFKVDPIKRKKIGDTLAKCEELICNEMLMVTEDGHFEYPLIEPIVDDNQNIKLAVLKFKNRRVRVEDVEKMNSGSDTDKMKRLISILTGVEPAFVNKFSLDDLTYLSDISLLFLPAQ